MWEISLLAKELAVFQKGQCHGFNSKYPYTIALLKVAFRSCIKLNIKAEHTFKNSSSSMESSHLNGRL